MDDGNSRLLIQSGDIKITKGRKRSSLIEIRSFLDPWYSLFSLGMFLVVVALYFVHYYVRCPVLPRLSRLICRPGYSLYILLYVTRSSTRHECPWMPGRLIPGWTADFWLRSQNMLLIVVYIDRHTHVRMGGYRFVAGPLRFYYCLWLCLDQIQNMVPPALASSGRDLAKTGVEVDMIFSNNDIGCLCGPFIAGALIEREGGKFLYAQVYAGSVIMCAALILSISRTLNVG